MSMHSLCFTAKVRTTLYTSVYPLLLCKIGVGGGLNHIGLLRFSDVCTRFGMNVFRRIFYLCHEITFVFHIRRKSCLSDCTSKFVA